MELYIMDIIACNAACTTGVMCERLAAQEVSAVPWMAAMDLTSITMPFFSQPTRARACLLLEKILHIYTACR